MTQVSGSTTDTTAAVVGSNTGNPAGFGVSGTSNVGVGVKGVNSSNTCEGVRGEGYYGAIGAATANWGCGVWGQMSYTNGAAISGSATGSASYGVWAQSTNGHGIKGETTNISYYGIWGNNTANSGIGIRATGTFGLSAEGTVAVTANNNINAGTAGDFQTYGTNSFSVYACSHGASGSYAGYFNGNVNVVGTLYKSAGSFMIDHPMDPENKYLIHSFVESDEMTNIYNGEVTLDTNGEAEVTLPHWFDSLNHKCTIQLTPVGNHNPKVMGKVTDGKFKIGWGEANGEVYWQVTGVRKDAFALANPMLVEVDKPIDFKGTLLHPEAHGALSSKSQLKKIESFRPTKVEIDSDNFHPSNKEGK